MKKKTVEQFIEEANRIHNHKFDYSKVVYTHNKAKVKIICPIHGEFEQIAKDHLIYDCYKCSRISSNDKLKLKINDFINRANVIHKNFYDYSRVIYKNNKAKVKIICPIHGEFEQRPDFHLRGCGCPHCKKSKGELYVKQLLDDNKIKYIPQHRFANCKTKTRTLPFDFYLPDYNTCVEFDGEQHFVGWSHNKNSLKLNQERDAIKTAYCKANNIPLIRIRYDEDIEQRIFELLKSLQVFM